eukprot:TRINITY_DN17220_c0_g1_i2.p1 TRINITY_DN17220_c0_g1~~TRINITY_DN17220_c0_g1_i2.p1  ORF type:complete len:386 (-),score=97.86 TRINITY_DN17220_c0_g1_i2:145-1302(-)
MCIRDRISPAMSSRFLVVWRLFGHLSAVYLLVRAMRAMHAMGLRASVKAVLNVAVSGASQLPGGGAMLEIALKKEVDQIEKNMLGDGDETAITTLPPIGLPAKAVLEQITTLKTLGERGFKSGKQWGGIYHAHEQRESLAQLQSEAWSACNHTNALYPGVFPSIRKFEAEIIAMVLGIVHGKEAGAVGLLTSGGTESILIAMHAYREQGVARGISSPEVICSVTAHPALDKACHYFGMKLLKISQDPVSQQLPPESVRAAIGPNTVAVYASAPSFSHGVVDPISDLSAICLGKNIGLHVDNCLGGFWLSFMQRQGLGRDFQWDFELPGVTTISVDVHKYGFSAKGASVVAFRNNELRRGSYVPVKDGSTLYITCLLYTSPSPRDS